jgi:hypothetical protein
MPTDIGPDLSIRKWCAKRGYSVTVYYNLKKRGLAPEVICPPGVKTPRITQRADAEWEEKMRALAASDEARREAERRTEQTRAAVKVAIQNGTHVSVQRLKARELRANGAATARADSATAAQTPRWKP